MNYKIRKASISDSSKVNSFLSRLIKDEKQYDININETCEVKCFYENFIPDDNNCVLVAEYDNNIIAYLYGYMENNGDAYIYPVACLDAMFVDEKFRNNGVGFNLINEFKSWATSKGAKYIELKVCNGNDSAIALYQKNGFQNTKSIMMLDLGE